jgi:hypothetical protein
VGVVVDVGLPQVLCLGVDVRLVIVFQGWVIVLVGMTGRHVLPLAAVPQVVHHVSVLVGVNDGVMGVLHGLPLGTPLCVRNLLAAPGPGRRGSGSVGLARGWPGRLLLPGLVPGTDSRNPLAARRRAHQQVRLQPWIRLPPASGLIIAFDLAVCALAG